MVVAAVACVVGFVVVVWVLYRDDPLPAPAGRRMPDWGPLPEPADLVRLDLPRSITGYEPASVDAHLDALVVAYRDLLAEAPSEVVARARRRAAARRGLVALSSGEPSGEPFGQAAPSAGGPPADEIGAAVEPVFAGPDDPREALRAEAVLASLRAAEGRRR